MILTPTALSEAHANAMSVPMLPSFVPGMPLWSFYMQKFIDFSVLNHAPTSPLKMTFMERFWNFYYTVRSLYVVDPQLNELFDEHVS
jgi:hypothetical protein